MNHKGRDLDEELATALNATNHDGYAAAARFRWPMTVIDLKEALGQLDEASHSALSNMKAVELGDELVHAAHEYMVRFCKFGPFDCDMEASKLIGACQRYREARGIEPGGRRDEP